MVLIIKYLQGIITILIVLTLILAFGYELRDLYKQNIRLRLDPLEEKSVEEISNCDIMALGSSSIRRWPFHEMNTNGEKIFNAGIDGQTSKQVLMRFERIIAESLPNYLILQVGLNDIKSIGWINSSQQIEKDMMENLRSIMELCTENKIKTVYVTNFPTGKRGLLRSLIWNSSLDKLILKTNGEMIEYCKSRNIAVFDAYSYLVSQNGLKRKPEYSKDFFHLNPEGYTMLNQILEIELQKIKDQI
jgi:lysophospholipase L1-like esterase